MTQTMSNDLSASRGSAVGKNLLGAAPATSSSIALKPAIESPRAQTPAKETSTNDLNVDMAAMPSAASVMQQASPKNNYKKAGAPPRNLRRCRRFGTP